MIYRGKIGGYTARPVLETAEKVHKQLGEFNSVLNYNAFLEAGIEGQGLIINNVPFIHMAYNGMEITRPFAHLIVDGLIVVTKANREKITGYDIFPIKTLPQHSPYHEALLINFHAKGLKEGVLYWKEK